MAQITDASWPTYVQARVGPFRFSDHLYVVLESSGEPTIFVSDDDGATWSTGISLGTAGSVKDALFEGDRVFVLFLNGSEQIQIGVFSLTTETWGTTITSTITVSVNSLGNYGALLAKIKDVDDFIVPYTTMDGSWIRTGIARHDGSWSTAIMDTPTASFRPTDAHYEMRAASRVNNLGRVYVVEFYDGGTARGFAHYYNQSDGSWTNHTGYSTDKWSNYPDEPSIGVPDILWSDFPFGLEGPIPRVVGDTYVSQLLDFGTGNHRIYALGTDGISLIRKREGINENFVRDMGIKLWTSTQFGSRRLYWDIITPAGSSIYSGSQSAGGGIVYFYGAEIRIGTDLWYFDASDGLTAGSWTNASQGFDGNFTTTRASIDSSTASFMTGMGTTHPGGTDPVTQIVESRVIYGTDTNAGPLTTSWFNITNSGEATESEPVVVSTSGDRVSGSARSDVALDHARRSSANVFGEANDFAVVPPPNFLGSPDEAGVLLTWDGQDTAVSYSIERERFNRQGDPI